MRALDKDPQGDVPDIARLCTTTWVLKDLRTKYCAQTGACVREFDHYCVWLNCAIGKGNHRQFVGLAVCEFLTQVAYLVVTWNMARTLVEYQSFGSWLFSVVTGYPLFTIIGIVQSLTCPWVFMLILHQCRLVAMNLTTNEMMNAHRYDHFWVTLAVAPGRWQKMYQNPFSKGRAPSNCLDFWWSRTRSNTATQPDPTPASAPASGGHGHSHGGHQCNADHGGGGHHGHGHGQ